MFRKVSDFIRERRLEWTRPKGGMRYDEFAKKWCELYPPEPQDPLDDDYDEVFWKKRYIENLHFDWHHYVYKVERVNSCEKLARTARRRLLRKPDDLMRIDIDAMAREWLAEALKELEEFLVTLSYSKQPPKADKEKPSSAPDPRLPRFTKSEKKTDEDSAPEHDDDVALTPGAEAFMEHAAHALMMLEKRQVLMPSVGRTSRQALVVFANGIAKAKGTINSDFGERLLNELQEVGCTVVSENRRRAVAIVCVVVSNARG